MGGGTTSGAARYRLLLLLLLLLLLSAQLPPPCTGWWFSSGGGDAGQPAGDCDAAPSGDPYTVLGVERGSAAGVAVGETVILLPPLSLY